MPQQLVLVVLLPGDGPLLALQTEPDRRPHKRVKVGRTGPHALVRRRGRRHGRGDELAVVLHRQHREAHLLESSGVLATEASRRGLGRPPRAPPRVVRRVRLEV